MKVSGFTFIRNALTYDYPVAEAIRSILPVCDEFVVAVGKSADATLELIRSIDQQKIRIIETVWDESLRTGGQVLAEETNKALAAVAADSDWCFYIQADEAVHEKYLPAIREAMERWAGDKRVDGLLFDYLHFYGSYDYVGDSSIWYDKEIRIVRNNASVYSYRDAQGFRKGNDEKLSVKPANAFMYHYGWVKDPRAMQQKQEYFNSLWHDDQWIKEHVKPAERFDYAAHIRALRRFDGGHPAVMQPRIDKINWTFDYDLSFNRVSMKDKFKRFLKRYLGIDLSYRNYKY